MFKLANNINIKKKINHNSYIPVNVEPDINGNRNINSISYSKKKTQINKNCNESCTGLWIWGLKPHS